jgi:hypothetical protein
MSHSTNDQQTKSEGKVRKEQVLQFIVRTSGNSQTPHVSLGPVHRRSWREFPTRASSISGRTHISYCIQAYATCNLKQFRVPFMAFGNTELSIWWFDLQKETRYVHSISHRDGVTAVASDRRDAYDFKKGGAASTRLRQ